MHPSRLANIRMEAVLDALCARTWGWASSASSSTHVRPSTLWRACRHDSNGQAQTWVGWHWITVQQKVDIEGTLVAKYKQALDMTAWHQPSKVSTARTGWAHAIRIYARFHYLCSLGQVIVQALPGERGPVVGPVSELAALLDHGALGLQAGTRSDVSECVAQQAHRSKERRTLSCSWEHSQGHVPGAGGALGCCAGSASSERWGQAQRMCKGYSSDADRGGMAGLLAWWRQTVRGTQKAMQRQAFIARFSRLDWGDPRSYYASKIPTTSYILPYSVVG